MPEVTDEPVRVRAPVVKIVDHEASTTVLGRELVRRFEGASAAWPRAVLEIPARPVRRSELFAELARRAGTTPEALPAQPIDELIRSEERRVGKECRSRWSPYH